MQVFILGDVLPKGQLFLNHSDLLPEQQKFVFQSRNEILRREKKLHRWTAVSINHNVIYPSKEIFGNPPSVESILTKLGISEGNCNGGMVSIER